MQCSSACNSTMKGWSVLQLFPCVLLLTFSLAESAVLRADLTHVDSGRGFTKHELLRRMVARSKARLASLRSSACDPALTAPVGHGGSKAGSSEYLIHLGIGTPRPQRVVLNLDTGSDLVWTQCACTVCFDQPVPVFRASVSHTFSRVPCSDPLCGHAVYLPLSGCAARDRSCFYAYGYMDHSITTGKMAEDTFTFKAPDRADTAAAVPNIRFGCGMMNYGLFTPNQSGIAGFGTGPLSLPSQLKVRRFSYCFTAMEESRVSPVFLGGEPENLEAHATGPIQSTPFAPGPAGAPVGSQPFYFLSLRGVTVGETRLPFNASTFALKGDGSGGTFIDSGTAITFFPQAVFRSLREAFVAQVPLPVAKGYTDPDNLLCFSVPAKKMAPAVPKLILHLEGADWELPRENYVLDNDDDGSGAGRKLCVVILSAGNSNGTIIGNFQQQNMHIVYDLESNKMVFAPARCDKL
ncbi:aspartic proteinase nepenthesin-1-like [Hordeum vulgare subsp. vulgare]|uniref:Peptidase A1 domain-containing protein n=1 Tax=Hordeum vulgare subsp. vulgare TaxID=112509 RepID=A0A8I6Y0P7_HORVV|nr:aspartic proteinase nepenthesin-1-like [Hordeum vulgare subsp. vulgare]